MTGAQLPPDDRPPEGAGSGRLPGGPGGRGDLGRRLTVGVASVEAVALAGAAVLSLLAGTRGGSLLLALGVAAVAAAAAYLLVEVARAFARHRRWPTGIFVTVQLLVALTALSLGSRSVLSLADNPRIGGLTLAALLVSGTGLVGVLLLARAGLDDGDGDVAVL